jgi:hypothetical protein
MLNTYSHLKVFLMNIHYLKQLLICNCIFIGVWMTEFWKENENPTKEILEDRDGKSETILQDRSISPILPIPPVTAWLKIRGDE